MNTPTSASGYAPQFVLDRRKAIPALIGRHEDFLIVTGLGNTARDIGALTNDGNHFFGIGGAMGAASMCGLGLALAQPSRRVLVVTGDGELLMSLGCLGAIALMNPPNLSIICVDNGHYGETGNQPSHTGRVVSLDKIAEGTGIRAIKTVNNEEDIAEGARLIRQGGNTAFILLRVSDGAAPVFSRNLTPTWLRHRFRMALLGKP